MTTNNIVQHKEIDGWLITTVWSGPHDPVTATVALKEIASNDTAVSWEFDPSVKVADVEFESEPTVTGGYAKFKIPLAVLVAFVGIVDTVNAKARIRTQRGPLPHPKPALTLEELIQQYKDGKFNPNDWNLCIDYNVVDLGDREGHRILYTRAIGFYVMGQGCGQCEYSFYWPAEEMTEYHLEAWIKKTFGVDHVLHGVG